MTQHTVQIKSVANVTHDVLHIVTTRPENYPFTAGQATDVAIKKTGWENKKRPFSFTSLPDDDDLEFTIKTYPSHQDVTNQLLQLQKGDELILHEVFGAIGYKGEGIFIAGGAGVTPFISIFRFLQSQKRIGDNKLILANKTKGDIIRESELSKLLGRNFINVLSNDQGNGYKHGYITAQLLSEHITDSGRYVYVCGPPPMMKAMKGVLAECHVHEEMIITEEL